MSGLEARIAEVLGAHLKRNITGCDCGWAEIGKSHHNHLAAMLAPVIREREAEAWDDGHDDGETYGYRLYQYERGYVDTLPDPINPYRSNDE